MGFKEAIVSAFSNYSNFSGRARRSEYWYFYLFIVLVCAPLSLLMNLSGDSFVGTIATLLYSLFTLAVLVPTLSIHWRRLHDTGRSGAWYFLYLVPLANILLLVWLCQDSQPGENAYGPNPKENNWTIT